MECDLPHYFTQRKRSGEPVSLLGKLQMLHGVAGAMAWLHGHHPRIIHRDLKTSNLMVDKHGTVKVGDFGLSDLKPDWVQTLAATDGFTKGSPLWMAPELFRREPFDERIDIYSFGLIIWSLLNDGEEPFQQLTSQMANLPVDQQIAQFVQYIMQNFRPSMPRTCPARLKELAEFCWHPLAQSRPAFDAVVPVLRHMFLEEALKDSLGIRMWETFFATKDEVPWDDFLWALGQVCELGDLAEFYRNNNNSSAERLYLACLYELLCHRQPGRVRIEQWGEILGYFGGFAEERRNWLAKVGNTCRQTWFHGDCSAQDSVSHLQGQPAGTFLIRFSREPPRLTISQILDSPTGGVVHRRLYNDNGRYSLQANFLTTYHQLSDLVNSEGSNLGLRHPCEGSRFQRLVVPPPDILPYIMTCPDCATQYQAASSIVGCPQCGHA